MNKTTLAAMAALIFIFVGVFVAIALARGYQIDVTKKSVTSTGILVVTSDPNGAEVLIDGKLKTATNNTINLEPGTYTVRIQKEGYSPWEKKIEIKKEEVFKTNAFLFPALADLRPLTFTGAINPVISPDETKIVYGVASASARLDGVSNNGIWVLDMGRNLPVSILAGGDLRQIYSNKDLSNSSFAWSADEKQILVDGGYLMDTDKINDNPTLMASPSAVIESWVVQSNTRLNAQITKLPLNIRDTLATSAGKLDFSPDETKVLYTATASATLPKYLTIYLPGTDPTPENRSLKPNNIYVYDLKEDKNYLIKQPVSWFPSSTHLLAVNQNQISVMEYDGTNQSVIFSGQFDPSKVFVWPNWSKIIILTSLGNTNGVGENLYTINIR